MKTGKKLIFVLLIVSVLLTVIAASILFLLGHEPQGFGIYLSQNNQVVITGEDVVWYNKSSHEMKLTEEGKNRVEALTVDVYGAPFAVKLNGKEIYNGSFWTPISSVSRSGIVIEIWRDQNTIVKIENGYPVSVPLAGTDPRNNSELLEYLQEMGKLTQ